MWLSGMDFIRGYGSSSSDTDSDRECAEVAQLAVDMEAREGRLNRLAMDDDELSAQLADALDDSHGFRTLPGLVRPKGV